MPSLHAASIVTNIEKSVDNFLLSDLSPSLDGIRIYLTDEHYPSESDLLPPLHLVSTVNYAGAISDVYQEDDGGTSARHQVILDLNICQKVDAANRETNKKYELSRIANIIKTKLSIFSGILVYDYDLPGIPLVGSLEPMGSPEFKRGGVYDGIRSAVVSTNLVYEEEIFN